MIYATPSAPEQRSSEVTLGSPESNGNIPWRIGDPREETLKEMIARGCTQEEVARELKAGRSAVSLAVIRLGLRRRYRRYWFPGDAREKDLRDLISQGYTHEEIAQILGTTHTTISRVVGRLGLRRGVSSGDPREERLRELHSQGYSQQEMARELGTSRSTVARAMLRLGLHAWNHSSSRYKQKQLQAHQKWVNQSGYTDMGELRREKERVEAAKKGWPQVEWLAQARILALLWDRGDLPRDQLFDFLKDICRVTLTTHLCELIRLHLVIVKGKVPGRNNRPIQLLGLSTEAVPGSVAYRNGNIRGPHNQHEEEEEFDD
jgi:DNA-binding CsgD family transcriptional regulator